MSKIQKPFGRVAARITIEADDNGTVRVIAANFPLIAPANAKAVPMDSREMVLALMKVSMDYTSAIFTNLKMEGQSNESKSQDQAGNAPKSS